MRNIINFAEFADIDAFLRQNQQKCVKVSEVVNYVS